jgi:hypothetical protein
VSWVSNLSRPNLSELSVMYIILYIKNSCVNRLYVLVSRDVVLVEEVQLQETLVELIEDSMLQTEQAVLLIDLDSEGVVDALNFHVLVQERLRVE